MKLHNYFRNTAGYRVRIALNLKGVDYEYAAVPLLKDAHRTPEFLGLNPQGLIPALEIDGHVLTQSLAIIDFIDRKWPEPALYPDDPYIRAQALSFALHITSDMHPLNNLRVLRRLAALGLTEEVINRDWYQHWIAAGFQGLEAMLSHQSGPYCFGTDPSIADICLVPQLFNARRFKCDLGPYPKLVRFADHAAATDAFARAAPERQPDAL